jgi:NAD(P)-dependent dehydrogenase (short-subunit alcohol dehydrogenase family)
MTDVSQLLRPGLLQGVSMLLAGAPADAHASEPHVELGAAVHAACAGLGARVSQLALDFDGALDRDETEIERAVERVLADAGSLELLVLDSASLFAGARARGGAGGGGDGPAQARAALGECLDASWNLTRAVANRAFLADAHGGRIVYLAPPPDAGAHAGAAGAGLENLARTLSIEWARHGITAVAIAPGAGAGAGSTVAAEVAALSAYLASPAGAYFSGCLLDLRGLGAWAQPLIPPKIPPVTCSVCPCT